MTVTPRTWTIQPGLRGDPAAVRLSASQLDNTDRQCHEFAALKARPQVWPEAYERRRYPPWESFPLGLVMAALDAVEFHGADPDDATTRALAESRSPLHQGAAVWVRHAVHAYVQSSAWLADELAAEDVRLRPERQPRVVQHESPAELRMLTAWGRWYASDDGTVREFRRLRFSRPGAPEAPSTHTMAFVAATGLRATGAVYRDMPVDVRPDDRAPERVRVVEVVLDTGTVPRVLIDATPDQIRRDYRVRAQPIAADLTFGGARRPGSDCAECKLRAHCDAVPHTPGLLGLADRGTHRRIWSVTTGRQYEICPAQSHLWDLRLPGDRGDGGSAVRRGVVVHEWLKVAHGRAPRRPCSLADLPEPGATDIGVAGEFMTPEEYREARPFLVQHLEVCPLAVASEDVRPEPTVVAYDSTADVLVVAGPDLLRRVDGRLVYREQKTTTRPDAFRAEDALVRVPQLALAVSLISSGAFGDGPGTVELEVMTPLRAEVISYDTTDPAVVESARRRVTELVHDWHQDTDFRARPGDGCATCPVARWCPDKAGTDPSGPLEIDGVLIDRRTGEVLDIADTFTGRAQAVADAIADPGADDEEVPF